MKRPLSLAVAMLVAIAALPVRADDDRSAASAPAPAWSMAQAAPASSPPASSPPASSPPASSPPASSPPASSPPSSPPAASPPSADRAPSAADRRAAPKIDLNSASEDTLATLRGIGPVRAKAIVDGRPYRSKDELVRRKIVPRGVYDAIKDRIVARQGTQ